MGDQPDRYSEEEVGLILRRAAEIQAGRSLTLAELEAAATEAGIDGALVRRAAVELRTRKQPEELAMRGIFGATRLAYERRIDGVLSHEDFDDLIAEIRRRLGIDGAADSNDKELAWRSQPNPGAGGRSIRVSVAARRTQTIILVEERTGGLAGGLYGGIMGGAVPVGVAWIVPVLVAAVGLPQLIPVLLVLWTLGTWYLARSIQRRVLESRHAELTALADGLEEVGHELAVAKRQ